MNEKLHRSFAMWDQFRAEMRDDQSPESIQKLRDLTIRVVESVDSEGLMALFEVMGVAFDTLMKQATPVPTLYTFRGKGRPLPAVIVVRDIDPTCAENRARIVMREVFGLDPNSICLVSQRADDLPVVYAWDGDY